MKKFIITLIAFSLTGITSARVSDGHKTMDQLHVEITQNYERFLNILELKKETIVEIKDNGIDFYKLEEDSAFFEGYDIRVISKKINIETENLNCLGLISRFQIEKINPTHSFSIRRYVKDSISDALQCFNKVNGRVENFSTTDLKKIQQELQRKHEEEMRNEISNTNR